jgi:hypothetical protein
MAGTTTDAQEEESATPFTKGGQEVCHPLNGLYVQPAQDLGHF